MNMIKLGPFSEAQINQIKEKLEPLGYTYKIEIDQDLVKQYQEKISSKSYYDTSSPKTAEPLGEFFYIDVNNESFLALKKYLNDLGMLAQNNETYLPDNELFCPACSYMALQDGYCPEHHFKLVDYFTKINQAKVKKEKSEKLFGRIFLILLALGFLIFAYRYLVPLIIKDFTEDHK